jgi:hypothetical protein
MGRLAFKNLTMEQKREQRRSAAAEAGGGIVRGYDSAYLNFLFTFCPETKSGEGKNLKSSNKD